MKGLWQASQEHISLHSDRVKLSSISGDTLIHEVMPFWYIQMSQGMTPTKQSPTMTTLSLLNFQQGQDKFSPKISVLCCYKTSGRKAHACKRKSPRMFQVSLKKKKKSDARYWNSWIYWIIKVGAQTFSHKREKRIHLI